MSGQVFHDIAEGIMAKNIRYPSKAAKDELSRFVPDVKRGNILAADYVLSKLGMKTNGGWNGSYVTGNPIWGSAKSDDKEVKLEKVAATPRNQMPDVIGMGARDAFPKGRMLDSISPYGSCAYSLYIQPKQVISNL